jgi:hypothetical protein
MTDSRAPWRRREFIGGLTLAGAAGFLRLGAEPAAAQAPPETKTVRFSNYPAICVAPQWVAEEMLRAEGFTDIQYADVPDDISSGKFLAAGKCDFSIEAAPVIPAHVEANVPMVALAGIHSGCRCSSSSRTRAGARSVRKTRCASTPSVCTRPGSSSRARRKSSRKAPTGGS